MKKYLFIIFFVGVWNCKESHLLNYEIQLSENNSEDTPLIILMHGYGNNAKAYSQKSEFSIGQTITIPVGAKHRVQNSGKEKLVFIEVQTGTYFGEDDIIRVEDDYKRV